MKVTRVVHIPLTYPLPYERLIAFTTFPAWNTLHLTQFLQHLAVHHKCHPDQCADTYHFTQQTTALQTASQYAQTAQMMKKRKISRWYPWMMNTGFLKKHLIELYAFMNMGYLMDYASTHVLTQTMALFSYVDSLDLSGISGYEHYMVTCSDEEILGMEEVPY